MSVWLGENWATIVILVLLLVLVFFAVRSVLKNRGGCHCGSGSCENCAGCSADRKKRGRNKD